MEGKRLPGARTVAAAGTNRVCSHHARLAHPPLALVRRGPAHRADGPRPAAPGQQVVRLLEQLAAHLRGLLPRQGRVLPVRLEEDRDLESWLPRRDAPGRFYRRSAAGHGERRPLRPNPGGADPARPTRPVWPRATRGVQLGGACDPPRDRHGRRRGVPGRVRHRLRRRLHLRTRDLGTRGLPEGVARRGDRILRRRVDRDVPRPPAALLTMVTAAVAPEPRTPTAPRQRVLAYLLLGSVFGVVLTN